MRAALTSPGTAVGQRVFRTKAEAHRGFPEYTRKGVIKLWYAEGVFRQAELTVCRKDFGFAAPFW